MLLPLSACTVALAIATAERTATQPLASRTTAAVGSNDIAVKEIAPRHYLISEPMANMVLYAGKDASLLAGVMRPSLVTKAKSTVAALQAGPIRYVVVMEDEGSLKYLDGGFGASGVLSLAHENLNGRLRESVSATQHRHDGAADDGVPAGRPTAIGVPLLSFSAVVQMWFEEEEIHAVHARSGYSDADVLVHYERSGILQLGTTFTNDGYPSIDLSRGGTIDGLVDAAEYFIREFGPTPDRVEPIVPGRGPVATMTDLRHYSNMLLVVRHRVAELIKRPKTLEQVLAKRTTAEFEERWGRGPVTTEQFVGMVYASLKKNTK